MPLFEKARDKLHSELLERPRRYGRRWAGGARIHQALQLCPIVRQIDDRLVSKRLFSQPLRELGRVQRLGERRPRHAPPPAVKLFARVMLEFSGHMPDLPVGTSRGEDEVTRTDLV